MEEDSGQSKAQLASLIRPPSLPDRDIGKQSETPPLMSLVPPVPGELERQPEERPKPARPGEELNHPETSPRGAKSHDEGGEGAAYPPRPVPSDDAGLLPASLPALLPGEQGMPSEPNPPPGPTLVGKMVAPWQSQPAHETGARLLPPLRPIPKGFIEKLDNGRFRVKTRNVSHARCSMG